jgi:uncharacterized protein YjdB
MKKFLKFIVIAALMNAAISCGEDDPQPTPAIKVTGVELNKATLSLVVGTKEKLTATVKPDDAANKNVTWSSSNTAAATVDAQTGEVTAVTAGEATITVTTEDGGKTASCEVTVTNAAVSVESVTLDTLALTLIVNETYTLTATVKPDDATNKDVTWSSSNTAVATVDEHTGEITAVAVGNATITVTTEDGGKTAACEVRVEEPPVRVESVTLDTLSLSMHAGETYTLTATVLPEDAANKNVTWSSSNTAAATVDEQTGEVTAIAAGEATITVTTEDRGKTAACAVTVNPDIYVGGRDGDSKLVVWKNGKIYLTMEESITGGYGLNNSMYISGDDIYTAGRDNLEPAVWKNGIEIIQERTYNRAHVESVFVYNGIVYAAGVDANLEHAVLWTDSVEHILESDPVVYASANSVFVADGNVYVLGRIGYTIKLWTNGTPEDLTDGIYNGSANSCAAYSVFVSGNDVYALFRDKSKNYLWKNGVKEELSNYSATLPCLFVSGNDVYMSGGSSSSPAVWKNGVREPLDTQGSNITASSIFVYGNDVYVAGFVATHGVVWKNGAIHMMWQREGTTGLSNSSIIVK